MNQYQIAVLVGSLRRDSVNRKLANAIVKLAPSEFAFRIVEIGNLPLYNLDDDTSPAESVTRFKLDIGAAHGLLFVTSEYNRSISGALKNAIDHASRPYGKNVLSGKPAGMLGVSAGALGTLMAQQHLRSILTYLNMPTLGQPEVCLQAKADLFDESGEIGVENKNSIQSWINHYVAWVQKFAI